MYPNGSNPWNKRIKFLIHTEVQYMWLQKPTINLITQPLKEKKNVFAPLNLYDMFKQLNLEPKDKSMHAIAALKRSLKRLRITMLSHSKQLL